MLALMAVIAALTIFSANTDKTPGSESPRANATANADAVADTAKRTATILEVRNNAFNDAVVYVMRSGMPVRLGTANGISTTRLTIPDDMIFGGTPLRFALRSIGGRGQGVTESIVVYRGDIVTMMIPPS
jgi:hypothetical protein